MRKVALFMAIILMLSMPLNVSAAPRAWNAFPSLGFEDTTAVCEVEVLGDKATDHIEVTMKLMRGNYCEATWIADDYGYLYMLEYDTVTKGHTYQLVVEVKINGVANTPVSVSGTC
ncbi:MAG: hypothetical protein E7468_01890 [Ruminococcaceae bacterium]|nr:hypothetical protein [Oscillospiraceae bacterium]